MYVTLQDLKTNGQTRVSGLLEHGTVKLEALKTGIYSVGAVVDADRRNGLARNRPMAGDYEGMDVRFHLVRNGDVATGALPVQRTLRLLRPEDTEMGLPPVEGCVRMKAPVEFEWDPVPLATGYRCFVTRRWREGEQWSSDYAKSSYGPATTCRFDLPTSAPGERYAIEIEAEGDVGKLTNFEDPRQGWASQYCFVVD